MLSILLAKFEMGSDFLQASKQAHPTQRPLANDKTSQIKQNTNNCGGILEE